MKRQVFRIDSEKMFDESEKRQPIREEERIRVVNIHGKLVFIGAEDDVLWDTCKYIRRMKERLERLPHDSTFESWLYEHGTYSQWVRRHCRRPCPRPFCDSRELLWEGRLMLWIIPAMILCIIGDYCMGLEPKDSTALSFMISSGWLTIADWRIALSNIGGLVGMVFYTIAAE